MNFFFLRGVNIRTGAHLGKNRQEEGSGIHDAYLFSVPTDCMWCSFLYEQAIFRITM